MANVFTDLAPTIYTALDTVSRELVGFIPASIRDARTERAALNDDVRSPVTPAMPAEDITPGTTAPDTGDHTFGNVLIQITKSRAVPFRWAGEEMKSLENAGTLGEIRQQQVTQAMRTLANEIEVDLAAAAKVAASRAVGTAGTTPFGSSLADSALALKILKDNGSPMSDLQLVIDTTAGANMRSLAQFTKANEQGSDATLRRGELLNLHGFSIRESAGISVHTQGTGSGYLVNGASVSEGDTVIPADTGTGTILAGDIVTFAADSDNEYVVTSALSGGSFSIGGPGLRMDIPDNNAITVGNDYTPNVAFQRNSLLLAARLPALPDGRDAAIDRMTVTDPVSGLSFEFAAYAEYQRLRFQVAMAWGVKGVKEDHAAILMG